MIRRNQTISELIFAFYQYCIYPFGQIHAGNPDIIALADKSGQTPEDDVLAMKMLNFASFDPFKPRRGFLNLDADYRLIIAQSFKKKKNSAKNKNQSARQLHTLIAFDKSAGQQIILADKFAPDKRAIQYHRDCVFETVAG